MILCIIEEEKTKILLNKRKTIKFEERKRMLGIIKSIIRPCPQFSLMLKGNFAIAK